MKTLTSFCADSDIQQVERKIEDRSGGAEEVREGREGKTKKGKWEGGKREVGKWKSE